MSPRDRISSHYSLDDPCQYRFERNTRLPHGTFDRNRIGPDAWVFICCAAIGAFLLIAGVIG